jgi:hypothetical protein
VRNLHLSKRMDASVAKARPGDASTRVEIKVASAALEHANWAEEGVVDNSRLLRTLYPQPWPHHAIASIKIAELTPGCTEVGRCTSATSTAAKLIYISEHVRMLVPGSAKEIS